MANSLIMWKDSRPYKEGRQILYSKLTQAADNGLIARTSFRFLVTGEDDEEYKEFEWKRYNSLINLLINGNRS